MAWTHRSYQSAKRAKVSFLSLSPVYNIVCKYDCHFATTFFECGERRSAGNVFEISTKRKQTSLSNNLQIISDVDSGQKQTAVAWKFGLSQKAVNTIVKNHDLTTGG